MHVPPCCHPTETGLILQIWPLLVNECLDRLIACVEGKDWSRASTTERESRSSIAAAIIDKLLYTFDRLFIARVLTTPGH